jgi:hypothetical protein
MKKLFKLFLCLLFATGIFFGGMTFNMLLRYQKLSLNKWGTDCVRIDSQVPLIQETYAVEGYQRGRQTLSAGYYTFCKQP